jgi:hypothetical protein
MSSRPLCLAVAACLVFGAFGSAASALAAGTVAFAPDPSGATTFVMPSGNIACVFTPAGGSSVYVPADGGPELSCDRAQPSYLRFILGAFGPAQAISAVGDPSCCGGTSTFAYGLTWQQAPFTCTSSTSGLACRRDDGHGFFISKAKINTY